jgi:hypothetical protein
MYSVLTPQMNFISFTNDPTIDNVLSFIYKSWKKHTSSESFQDWCNELNESGEYESQFTVADAIDNLASEFSLYINRKPVDASDLYKMICNKYANK